MADVCGHGAAAAVLMAVTHAIAHSDPTRQESAAAFLDYLNRRIYLRYTHESRAFITAFYGVYDPRTRGLTYASAGHDPIRVHRQGEADATALDAVGNMPLGIRLDEEYEEGAFEFRAGDVVVLYTDGITEQRNRATEQFGVGRLDTTVAEVKDRSAEEILSTLLSSLGAFAESETPHDDRTIVIATIDGSSSED